MTGNREKPWSYPRLRRGYVTPELISGTVLVSVVIAVADETGGITDVFGITIASVLVFWATQVFVITIALQGMRGDDAPVQLSASLNAAIRRAKGLLFAAVRRCFSCWSDWYSVSTKEQSHTGAPCGSGSFC